MSSSGCGAARRAAHSNSLCDARAALSRDDEAAAGVAVVAADAVTTGAPKRCQARTDRDHPVPRRMAPGGAAPSGALDEPMR